jgi:hypothetical protein
MVVGAAVALPEVATVSFLSASFFFLPPSSFQTYLVLDFHVSPAVNQHLGDVRVAICDSIYQYCVSVLQREKKMRGESREREK